MCLFFNLWVSHKVTDSHLKRKRICKMGAVVLAYFRFLRPYICLFPQLKNLYIIPVFMFWTQWKDSISEAEDLINNKPSKHYLASDSKKWMFISSTDNEVFYHLQCCDTSRWAAHLCEKCVFVGILSFVVRRFLLYLVPVVWHQVPAAHISIAGRVPLRCAVPKAAGFSSSV